MTAAARRCWRRIPITDFASPCQSKRPDPGLYAIRVGVVPPGRVGASRVVAGRSPCAAAEGRYQAAALPSLYGPRSEKE